MLLTNIFERKQEAKNPYVRLVEVTEETTDSAPWGVNWPREYEGYLRTNDVTRTTFGGSEALPEQKIERDPWLKRMFAGYAFALDYRDRRGHAYMLFDQEKTRRVTDKPQPGSCLHCHSSVIPTYRRLGGGDVLKGFEPLGKMIYADAHAEVVKTGSSNPVAGGPVTHSSMWTEHIPLDAWIAIARNDGASRNPSRLHSWNSRAGRVRSRFAFQSIDQWR